MGCKDSQEQETVYRFKSSAYFRQKLGVVFLWARQGETCRSNDMGEKVLSIYNERVAGVRKKFQHLRTAVLVKSDDLLELAAFELDTIMYDAKGFWWQWIEANGEYLLPVPVLAAKFRGKFLAYLSEAFNPLKSSGKPRVESDVLVPPHGSSRQQCLNLFNKLGRVKWLVQIEPAYDQARGAMKYIGRYIRRGPLSEKRIGAYDGESMTIAYAHPEKHERRTFQLNPREFVRRVLTHVPEKGTHCARVYGLYHSACRKRLNLARSQLGQPPYEPETETPDTHELLHRMFPDYTGFGLLQDHTGRWNAYIGRWNLRLALCAERRLSV